MRGKLGTRAALILAVGAVALLIAACGGGSSGSDEPTDAATAAAETGAPAQETTSSDAQTEAEASGEPVTLVVWDFLDRPNLNGPANDEIDARYMEEHPNVTIKREWVPIDSYWAKIQAAIAAKKGPDIVGMYPGTAAREYARGLLPLDDRITDEQKEDISFLTQATTDGKLLAIPFTAYAYVMEFNTELFDQVGLDPETALADWDSLLAACQTFNDAGITPIAAGFRDGFYGEWILFVLGSQLFDKASIVDQNTGAIPWTDSRYQSALKHIGELRDAGCFSDNSHTRTMEEGFDEFYSGEAAMYFSVGAREDKIETLGREKVGYAIPPQLPDSAYPSPMTDSLWGSGFSITNWSEHPDEAFDFLSYYTGGSAMETISKFTPHQLPSSKSANPQTDDPLTQELIEISQLPDNQSIYVGFSTDELVLFERLIPEYIAGRVSEEELISQLEDVRMKGQQ